MSLSVHYACPAIDLLFESAALTYREQLVGVLLTGANENGAQGLSMIRECGGIILVQDSKRGIKIRAIAANSVNYNLM